VPVVLPEPKPAPAPVVVAPAPPTFDRRYAKVTLKGDVSRVYLQSASGNTALPADVLPGTYQVLAFFESEPVAVGEVTLVAGTEKILRCTQELRKCK
jgi:hypothetical protein